MSKDLAFLDLNPPTGLEGIIRQALRVKPQLLKAYDKYVLHGYNPGKEVAFGLSDPIDLQRIAINLSLGWAPSYNDLQKFPSYSLLTACLTKAVLVTEKCRLARCLLVKNEKPRGQREKRLYAARRMFLDVEHVYHFAHAEAKEHIQLSATHHLGHAYALMVDIVRTACRKPYRKK